MDNEGDMNELEIEIKDYERMLEYIGYE